MKFHRIAAGIYTGFNMKTGYWQIERQRDGWHLTLDSEPRGTYTLKRDAVRAAQDYIV